MADTQSAPHTTESLSTEGSMSKAQEAILGLMGSVEDNPEAKEASPTEEAESTEETQDEPLEAESEDDSEEYEEESEESDEEDEQEEEPDAYTVKVNGEAHEVTLEELVKGYSRQSDYTKKTQEIAEERGNMQQALEMAQQEVAQIQQEREEYVASLQNVINNSNEHLQQFMNIDWERLKEESPIEYVTLREDYRDAQDRVQAMFQQQEMVKQKQSADAAQQHQTTVAREHAKLSEKLPEWGDEAKRQTIGAQLRDYAIGVGYSANEIGSLVDHRSLLVLRKAMFYDKANPSKVASKKLKNKPKVVSAGSAMDKSSRSKSQRKKQMGRLQKTGHVDDAVSLFEDFVEL
tara:strand:- start:99 stop:1142 length:1044 start_codon:yes stop_codon:yes gene_type:complete